MATLLRKQIAAAEAAAAQATDAQRLDLRDKENRHIQTLQAYLAQVRSLGDDEVRKAALDARHALLIAHQRCDQGVLMKRLLGPDGLLKGKVVDNRQVAEIVNNII